MHTAEKLHEVLLSQYPAHWWDAHDRLDRLRTGDLSALQAPVQVAPVLAWLIAMTGKLTLVTVSRGGERPDYEVIHQDWRLVLAEARALPHAPAWTLTARPIVGFSEECLGKMLLRETLIERVRLHFLRLKG